MPLVLLLLLGAGQAAPTLEFCRPFREQRDARAAAAMEAELQLVRRTRLKLCPALERQAESANADARGYGPIDYTALLECRNRAEALLREQRPVLYRNTLGFVYYTPEGAAEARRADALRQQARQQGCR